MTTPQAKYSAKEYNLVAKVLREEWPINGRNTAETRAQATTLVLIAMNFCRRFKADNPSFDPVDFLDRCTPNPNLYPLSQLWEDSDDA